MTHLEVPTDHWLDLSAAAEMLGVHFTTLRRWADAGQVPSIRTPGGRRRFRRSELEAFLKSRHRGELPAPLATVHGKPDLRPASGRQPSQHSASVGHPQMAQQPWYGRLDESQRATFRSQGQGLMAVLMQYVTRSNGGDVFLAEGRRIAHMYGEACARAGLTLLETLQTFVHVRRSFMDPVYEAGTLAGTPDADTWRIYDRTNAFLDAMLVAMLESFYAGQQRQPAALSQ